MRYIALLFEDTYNKDFSFSMYKYVQVISLYRGATKKYVLAKNWTKEETISHD